MIEKRCTTCKNLMFKYEPCGTQIVSCDEGVFVDEYKTRDSDPGSLCNTRPCEIWADRWIAESNPEWRKYD